MCDYHTCMAECALALQFAFTLQVSDLQSNALFILLVEKDAAFMRLAEDRFYNTYPCIILTAKGQPDVASRWRVLHHSFDARHEREFSVGLSGAHRMR